MHGLASVDVHKTEKMQMQEAVTAIHIVHVSLGYMWATRRSSIMHYKCQEGVTVRTCGYAHFFNYMTRYNHIAGIFQGM